MEGYDFGILWLDVADVDVRLICKKKPDTLSAFIQQYPKLLGKSKKMTLKEVKEARPNMVY